MGSLSHNSDSRYARKSTNGSKDAIDRLVSTESLSQKMAHFIGAQSQVSLGKDGKTWPYCDVTNRKPRTHSNIFFQSQ